MASLHVGNTRIELSQDWDIGRASGIDIERRRILGIIALMELQTPEGSDIHTFLGRTETLKELRQKIQGEE